MKRLLSFIALFFVTAFAYAQSPFNGRYLVPGYASMPRMAINATQGGYLILTYLQDTANPIILNNAIFLRGYNTVIKTDSAGNPQWISCFKDPTIIHNYSYNRMIATQDSGVALIGFNEYGHLLLTHLDKNGQPAWAKRIFLGNYPADPGDLLQTASGNYVVCATAEGAGFHQPVLVCYDPQGNLLWNKTYDTNQSSISPQSKVVELPGGDLLLSFCTYTSGNELIRTNAQGSVVWKKYYGLTYPHWSKTVDMSVDTVRQCINMVDVYMSGVILRNCDYAGNVNWEKSYFDSAHFACTVPNHISIAPDHGLLVSGIGMYSTAYAGNAPPRERMFILKTDSNGIFQWFRLLPVFAQDEIRYFLMANYTDNGEILLCGMDTSSSGPNLTATLMPVYGTLMSRLSSDGNSFCGTLSFTGTQPAVNYYSGNIPSCITDTIVTDAVSPFYQFFVIPGDRILCEPAPENVPEIQESSLQVFPNPAGSQVIFLREDGFHKVTLEVFNANGECVSRSEDLSGDRLLLDVSSFAEGIYFCRVTDGKEIFSNRISVIH